jgi:2-iminobutanoate/2-iminopropanoate deaminase
MSAAGVPAAEKEERMVLKSVQTEQAPAAIGPYVQAIVAGPLQFVSGQLGLNPQTGELAGTDLASQARQALENLKQIVVAAGCALEQVAAVDVFLTNMGEFAEFNRIYEEFFAGHRPARAVVEVNALPKGALVEVKCVAYAGS